MTAIKRSRLVLLCLFLAVASLLGVFAIIDASSANASTGIVPPPSIKNRPNIIITPAELDAILYPGEMDIQSLWITNTADTPITYTLYEISAPLKTTSSTLLPVTQPVVDPEATRQVTAQGKALVIISLREVPDLSPAYLIPDKSARRKYVYNRLLESFSHSQLLFNWLDDQGAHPERLVAANAIAATVTDSQLEVIATHPLVRQIQPNREIYATVQGQANLIQPMLPAITTVSPDTVEWNIARIRADETWSTFGITGQGAVVGIMDTGVMYDHAALVNSYRGNLGDGTFDHNFNWMDFVNDLPVPYDGMGHGTMITGIVTGDDGGANQIGIAPGANWIAAKVCTDGGICTDYDILHGFDWMLAPTDLNGQNADPTKAPDILFGGWGGGFCDDSWQQIFLYIRAAGILPIFPGGHSGPACGSIGSLGDREYVLTAGMTNQDDSISYFSPRGPSCSGSIKPDVVAPGENIRSSFNNGDYEIWSGSAESSAHVAGVAALMISANPGLAAGLIEPILYNTSLCHEDLACGGETCPGQNNVYGYGRIDAYEAVYAALGYPPHTELPWLREVPISGTLPVGGGTVLEVTFDSSELDAGIYNGAIGILTNDPIQPFTVLSVNLEVLSVPMPILNIDPLFFSASLPWDGILTDTLTLRNDGDAPLSFSLHEISGQQKSELTGSDLSIPDPYPPGMVVDVDAEVRPQLLFLGRSRLVIFLRGGMDFTDAIRLTDQAQRGQYVYDRLLALASRSAKLDEWLQLQGADPHRLLTTNAIAATLDAKQLAEVLKYPEVGRVSVNGYAQVTQEGANASLFNLQSLDSPAMIDWNIAKIRADETWSELGITGEGAVVGVIDTGVTYDHPALVSQYRGTLEGGMFDHNYNWFDLVNGLPVPYDDVGHGTMGMGIVVGDDGGENQIGVAPGAKWIAVKACDNRLVCSDEDLYAAADWMLAPYALDGTDPDPSRAPKVVLNMWGGGSCNDWFQAPLLALRAAGILPVFASGGTGPGCSTIASPADSPDVITAGTTDINDNIAPFSARGPSCYDGIKPDLSAPGVEIRTSTNVYSYTVTSGTSWAAAHTAGAAALIISADQSIEPNLIEETLFSTAVCREGLACGGDPCPGANNTYGHGRIDVFEAVSATLTAFDDVPWLVAGPLEGELLPGETITTEVGFNTSGLAPGTFFGGIEVESNDPLAPLTTLPVTLIVMAPCEAVTNLEASFTPPEPFIGDVVSFAASAEGTQPITYTWDIDGEILEGVVVVYTFTHSGKYQASVSAENACTDPLWVNLDVSVREKVLLPIISK